MTISRSHNWLRRIRRRSSRKIGAWRKRRAWSPLGVTELLEDRTLLSVSAAKPPAIAPATALVKVATTTVLSSSANPSKLGQPLTFTATVSGVGGTPTGNVTFEDGSTVLGTVSLAGGNATLPFSRPMAPGNHNIAAFYKGSSKYQSSTSAVLKQAFAILPVANPVSVADSTLGGRLGNADSTSGPFAISPDGRYVAFASSATNLVPGDTNGLSDIFVRDTRLGTTTSVSTDSTGNQANGASLEPAIAVDSRGDVYVAFASAATNLVAGATSGTMQIYLRDLGTGITTLVSSDGAGNEGNYTSLDPAVAVDANGTVYVGFDSYASNIVSGAGYLNSDVFVKNMTTSVTTLVSTGPNVHQSFNSSNPALAIDAAGNVYVAFASAAKNLVSGDTVGVTQIYVRNLTTAVITCASTDSSGNQVYGIFGSPTVAVDRSGNVFVAFESDATTLVSGDTNGVQDVFVKALTTGITTRVSTDSAGNQANAISGNPALAVDPLGKLYVAFWSAATNLVSTGMTGVFMKNLTSDVTTWVGPMGGSNPYYPAVAADGMGSVFVAFWYADNAAYQEFVTKFAVNATFGLDVSMSQGNINWAEVQGTGAQTFAFIEATGGISSPKFVNYFNKDAPKAIAAGLVVGAYHFADPNLDPTLAANPSDIAQLLKRAGLEADYFARIAGKYLAVGNLQPVLDLEQAGFQNIILELPPNQAWSEVAMFTQKWIAELQLKVPGVKLTPILYMPQGFAQNLATVPPSLSLEGYQLWVANPANDPSATPNISPWNNWAMMQWTSTGESPGISANTRIVQGLDLDVVNPSVDWSILTIKAMTPAVAPANAGDFRGNPAPGPSSGNVSGASGTFSFTYSVDTSATDMGLSTAPSNAGQTTRSVGAASRNDTFGFAATEPNSIAVRLNVAEVVFGACAPLIPEGGATVVDEGSGVKNKLSLAESPTADNLEAVLDCNELRWAGLTAALEILSAEF
jgi:GH25 family lysozyme M1 (1,4-beta-N-acetylmuramidase)